MSEIKLDEVYKLILFSKKEIEFLDKKNIHEYGNGHRCRTDGIGYPTPSNKNPLELVVNASEGFVPLWEKNTILYWRFDEQSFSHVVQPESLKNRIRGLLGRGILAWGDSAPVKFAERNEIWDFQISLLEFNDCGLGGCTLARAFFPDSGRHNLEIYPRMFDETEQEQVETIAHEIGHIFGLRHFFAKISETAWPAEIFGTHKPFSIMNYGVNSQITLEDKDDLKKLYQLAWSGQMPDINGTPIKFVHPYHNL